MLSLQGVGYSPGWGTKVLHATAVWPKYIYIYFKISHVRNSLQKLFLQEIPTFPTPVSYYFLQVKVKNVCKINTLNKPKNFNITKLTSGLKYPLSRALKYMSKQKVECIVKKYIICFLICSHMTSNHIKMTYEM